MKINELGQYDILFRVVDDKNNIEYIAYTDNTKDEEGRAKIYLGKYANGNVFPLDTLKEKEDLEKIVRIVQKEVCKNER